MPPVYLKDLGQELRLVGEAVWKQRYRSPVLVVTGRAAELVDGDPGQDTTAVAARSDVAPAAKVALLDRVFTVVKAPHAPRGPVVLGRSSDSDIAIPEYSISKRHCLFEFELAGVKLTDCGSTNGTILGGTRLQPGQSVMLKGGEALALGRFAFTFYTAAGFLAYVKSLALR